jgi:hypothetical protein
MGSCQSQIFHPNLLVAQLSEQLGGLVGPPLFGHIVHVLMLALFTNPLHY